MKKLTALFLALALCLSLCTVAFAAGSSFAITNGTAQGANGSISFDKTSAAEGETVTITVNPADGYQLKSLTAVPATPTKYTVTFDVNGVGTAPSSQTVEQGGTVTKPTDPSDSNHTFGGWYKDSGYLTEWNFNTDTVTSNTTIYAKWERTMESILNTVDFPSYDGSVWQSGTNRCYLHETTKLRFVYGSYIRDFSLTDTLIKSGNYYIKNWDNTDYLKMYLDDSGKLSSIELHYRNTHEYGDYAHYFSGTYTAPASKLFKSSPAKSLKSSPADPEVKFVLQTDGTYQFTMPGYAVTVTAVFEVIPTYYTVTFNANGHGTAPVSYTNVISGKTIDKPIDPTAAGYTFDGWYKETGCTNAWDFANDTVTTDTTLYAKWTKTGGGHHGGGTATVQSAKTADAGIAIYGVLSVSSLIGMGWVSKRKH